MPDIVLGPAILFGSMLGLLFVTRFVFGIVCRVEGFSFTHESVVNDNPAIGIRIGSLLLAAVISFIRLVHPSGISWKEDLNFFAWYGLLVIFLLLVSRYVNDAFILYDFNNNLEVVGEKNVAVAIVEGSTYLATAFIMSGALAGWEGGFWTSIAWFVIGQGLLVILGLVYRLAVRGMSEALDTHNISCAFSFGGFLLSAGIALGSAISGPFSSWSQELPAVGIYLGAWFLVMFVSHLFADRVVLPTVRLRTEVMKDRNIGAGAIEGMIFLGATVFLTSVL